MFRKLWLINGNDDRYNLTDSEHMTAFATDLNGFGMSNELGGFRLGDAEILTYKLTDLKTISLKLVFPNNSNNSKAYSEYINFRNFLSIAPLYIYYLTPDKNDEKDAYYKNVSVIELTKTEVSPEDNTLICEISLKAHHLWLSSFENEVLVIDNVDDSKKYELTRPYFYGVNSLDNVVLFCNSTTDTPCLVEVNGLVENLDITVFNHSNVMHRRSRIIGVYDFVKIDAFELSETLMLRYDNIYEANPLSKQDLTVGVAGKVKTTFIWLKPGKNVLKIASDNEFNGEVLIKWRERYATV